MCGASDEFEAGDAVPEDVPEEIKALLSALGAGPREPQNIDAEVTEVLEAVERNAGTLKDLVTETLAQDDVSQRGVRVDDAVTGAEYILGSLHQAVSLLRVQAGQVTVAESIPTPTEV